MIGENVAVTFAAAFMVTVHVDVPEQAPLHPPNVDPAAGVAVSVTTVPLRKLAAQALPQAMPDGVAETVPLPPPAFAIAST